MKYNVSESTLEELTNALRETAQPERASPIKK
jgi:hypothetical protein